MNGLRVLLAAVVAAPLAAFDLTSPASADQHGASAGSVEQPAVTVYKSPYCGCCEGWIEHMKARGYAVSSHDMLDLQSVKTSARVPAELESCHTAVVGGYALEGHVPADAVDRLLRERPDVAGLAVPGMPVGSPGMEGPNPETYDVMTFDKTGGTSVYMSVVPTRE
ncbi:MAG: DUF411 domain-containing protein [Rhodospirillales bacterium]|nr:DUF411 domain-containing protein [Rhodospirillales bacterium]